MTNSTHTARELDARSGDGLDVRLLWNPADGSVMVTVADARTDEHFLIPVASHEALEAFRHPFTYAGAPDGIARNDHAQKSIKARTDSGNVTLRAG